MITESSYRKRYRFFDDAADCAKAAAPVFERERWSWGLTGIPSEQRIFSMLLYLADQKPNVMIATGRLIYHAAYGFGYKRPTRGDQ